MIIKKHVLILCPFFRPNLGGVETHLNDLCEYLGKSNFYVYVLTYQPITTRAGGLSLEKKRNLEIRRVSWFGHGWFHKLESYPLIEFLYLFPGLFIATLWFMIKNHSKIDAIHAHGFIAATVTRLVTLIYPKTTTMSTHAIYEFKKRGMMALMAKWILSGLNTVMPLAEASKNDLIAAGVPREKIKNYVQWVDQKLFKPRNKFFCRRRLKLDGDFFVLFVGRLIEKKGARILLKVARDLPKLKFIFVGDGPMLEELKKAEKEQKNISVVGMKSQRETALYYGAADIITIPSQYKEGFARVVLEALSSGRPVIASNKGCLPEMISQEVGILIKPTEKKIREELQKLYHDRKRLKDLSQEARPYAEKHFSEKNAAEIAKNYFKKKQ